MKRIELGSHNDKAAACIIRSLCTLVFLVALLVSNSAVHNVYASETVQDKVTNMLLVKKDLIEQEISFTKTEGEQFWPIYHEYENEIRPVIQQIVYLLTELAESQNVSKAEIDQFIDNIIEKQKQSALLHAHYAKQFNTILSPAKTTILLGILLAF